MATQTNVIALGNASAKKAARKNHTPSNIQSDTLFTFVTQLDYIISTIKNKMISPRYCCEDIRYLKISKLKKIAYPMKCLCDINMHRLDVHLEWYGYYGLAFSKDWGMRKGIQAIQYINKDSALREDFSTAFSAALKIDPDKETKAQTKMKNFLLHEMMYYKPYEGKMKNRNTGKTTKVTVGCDKYNRDLLVRRVAHNSTDTMAFESDQNDSLRIKYYLNQRNHSFKMNMSFDLKNAKTIRDTVESTMIYNAFLDGKGSFMGHKLHDAHTEKDSIRFDDNSAKFWEKVLQVEQALNVHFTPPQDDVDFETMCLVEKLYQNPINKTPIKENQVIDSINGKWIPSRLSKEIRDSIGKPALFEFVAVKHVNLFGVQKDLPALLQVFNAVLADYHPTQNKISVVDESSEKQRYTSSLCFLSDEELEMYKSQDHNQIISFFQNAKRAQEFLEYSS